MGGQDTGMSTSLLPDTGAVAAGRLGVGGVALGDLAARHGTPLLVYDEATLRNRARAYREGLRAYPGPSRLAFACKAQSSVALLRVLLEEGLGMDVASEGELAFAVAAGTPGDLARGRRPPRPHRLGRGLEPWRRGRLGHRRGRRGAAAARLDALGHVAPPAAFRTSPPVATMSLPRKGGGPTC
jgi:hypothetical protein